MSEEKQQIDSSLSFSKLEETKKIIPLSIPQQEEEVLDFWERADTFQKTLQKESLRGEYTFYDGPPFATGTPHYGHIVASLIKDAIPRYQTMRGYHVERKWGWDCHGLPIENIVEKELGTKSKKEVEDLGVAKFNNLCRTQVLTYVDDWQKIIRRLGRWADMKHAYRTMDLNFMDSVWWAFKRLWDQDLIYKDYRSMHICPRCETTLSQSEVAEGYWDVKDLAVTAKFELIDEPGTYLLAWTTTPWTLIANVALAVGGDIKYVKVKVADAHYIVAKKRLEHVFPEGNYEIVERYEGYDLSGRAYRPVFDYYYHDHSLKNREQGWKVYLADFVTTTDGTGIVHLAPAFGEEDMKLGKEKKLPFIQHVGLDGIFKAEVKDFPGLHVKPADNPQATDVEIIKYLAAHETLFSKEKYEHSYPHCWRCETPLLNYATSSWFVNVVKIKKELLKTAKGINWSPSYVKEGRFGNWLQGAHDWSISRQRFWASVIPIWECASCGARKVVGSVAELEELTGTEIKDIHKDKVDPLTFKCQKCEGEMKRVSDVLDCWFESGAMPFAELHYPVENKSKFEHNFPAQFIAEGIDQTRTWFYYLHVLAGGLFQKRAFSNVIVNGIVLAEDGKKMSKRLHNYPDPLVIMEKYSSDALRAYLLSSPVMLAENLNFSEKGVQEALRKNILILENVYKFYEMFALESDQDVKEDLKDNEQVSENVLDRWILLELKLLVNKVTTSLEAYDLVKASRAITAFIDELSTWYLRRSRERFKSDNLEDKFLALKTTKAVLITLSKLMAPFMPFIAERIWQKTTGFNFKDEKQSVHLESWPADQLSGNNFIKRTWQRFGSQRGEEKILQQMSMVRKIAELGLAKRDMAKIKIRQMLASLTVQGMVPLDPEYRDLVLAELNIQNLLFTKPQAPKLTVELDTVLSPELKQEGLKREIIRSLNLLRKENKLTLQDQVQIYYQTSDSALKQSLLEMKTTIMKETLARDFLPGLPEQVSSQQQRELKFADQVILLSLEK